MLYTDGDMKTTNETTDVQIYTDQDQCEAFGVSYFDSEAKLVVYAETLLGSKDYDEKHKEILESLGTEMLVLKRNGDLSPGWWKITRVIK